MDSTFVLSHVSDELFKSKAHSPPRRSPPQGARCSPPLPPNALGVSPPGETYSKGVKTGMLIYWEKQRQEIKVTLKGYRRK